MKQLNSFIFEENYLFTNKNESIKLLELLKEELIKRFNDKIKTIPLPGGATLTLIIDDRL